MQNKPPKRELKNSRMDVQPADLDAGAGETLEAAGHATEQKTVEPGRAHHRYRSHI